ncbi:MAG: 16S rRNA (guanine(527)-N(7))-methyltransferase RsmG [Candidatus Pelagibacter bacterium]|nr:16S rRNA (guanine(527)-N(7))-methyltransferase RsmG [Candidatus Pelagibacter bacterium]
MIDSNTLEYKKLDFLNVSRETFSELEEFRILILEKNKEINLISSNTEAISRERHILDSAQIIDFIDKNDKLCTDIGSGSGLPGIVLAIIMKHKKSNMKFYLYEKSFHKSNFLKEVSKKFNLNTKIFQKNIFHEKNLETDLIVARAFKPLPVILDLVNSNFEKFKNIILFLGKNGKEILSDALRKWQFEYKKKKSLTGKESFLIKISNLKKK